MPDKVLVDVSVFEDIVLKRNGLDDSLKLLKRIEEGSIDGWISSLTKVNLYYLNVKRLGEDDARKIVSDLTKSFSEIPLRKSINEHALAGTLPKFEDNITIESVKQFHLGSIITRSKKNYSQTEIPVYSPNEYLNLIDQRNSSQPESVPFLDLKAQHHQIYNEIDDRITDIIANTGFILGKYVEEFEDGFAKLQSSKYCIGVSSGTDALHVALLALGIGPGDSVIVPVNTFIATAEAVSLTGAVPVFVDCDKYYNMDVGKVEEVLRRGRAEGQKVIDPEGEKIGRTEEQKVRRGEGENGIRAIIPVHLYGQPANMDEIIALADEYDIKVVEDCCQAHLAELDGKKVGNFGEFGAFSFYPGKNLGAYGEGGALVTNDEDLFNKAKMIRQHGEIERYHHKLIGHNYRMSAIQGAVLGVKIKSIEEWTRKRQENALIYSGHLEGVKGIEIPKNISDASCVYHLYVIQANDRDGLQKFLQENGVASGLHYPIPLHLQEAYSDLGYKKGDFPMAEEAAGKILSLPMYPELSEDQIVYVCDVIRKWQGMKRKI